MCIAAILARRLLFSVIVLSCPFPTYSACHDVEAGIRGGGGSDCPNLEDLCDEPSYADMMEENCPYTCGYCDSDETDEDNDDDYRPQRQPPSSPLTTRNEQYTLYYLPHRGRGEEIRLMFRYTNVAFNDVRYTREYWTRELKNKTMYGLLPILQLGDGRMLAQSYAIERFLARRFGLAGRDEFEQAKVDEFADFHKDVDNEFYAQGLITEEVDPKRNLTALAAVMNQFFPFYSRQLLTSASSFGLLFPSGATWIDFVVANWLESIHNLHRSELEQQWPDLEAYRQRVNTLPQLAAYIAARPFSVL